jgi:diadenosine tetraphosphate (Ap4A) HIT family hydrolase
MTEIDRLWAGWRSEYVQTSDANKTHACVFCGLLASDRPGNETNIVWRNDVVAAILNAYPYGTGHVLVMPVRHVGRLDELSAAESSQMWASINDAAAAINEVYQPTGMNLGFNIGEGSGAGLPDHLHAHALPRWKADTNFITAVANAKVLPEALDMTWKKLNAAWPA